MLLEHVPSRPRSLRGLLRLPELPGLQHYLKRPLTEFSSFENLSFYRRETLSSLEQT